MFDNLKIAIRKQKKLIIFLICIMFFYLLSYGNDNIRADKLYILQKALTDAVDNKIKSRLYNDVILGIQISTTDGKYVLYSHNIDKPMITASAIKLISSASALIKLGPEYRFITPLMTDGRIEEGVLRGNLYIKGRGDPSLKIDHLKEAAKKLKEIGINKISGDIIYDISFFDEEKNRYAPNARNLYAPPCALTANYGWLDVIIKNKTAPELRLVPQTSYAKLKYDVNISSSEEPGRPDMTYIEYDWGDFYAIKGTVTRWDKKYHYVWLGASRPGLYAATLLKEICQKEGIKVTGRIEKQIVPKNAVELMRITSGPLSEIVKTMNQESNNVIAEILLKDLGAVFLSAPGTRKKGLSVLRDFCTKDIGITDKRFSIGDASGLSVNNRFSALHFIEALNFFYEEKNVRGALIPTLARQGYHPHAMVPVPPDNIRIYVKTGTLSVRGVNTVVGYIIIDQINEVFSFAVLANRFKAGPMTYSGTLTVPLLITIVNAIKDNIE